MLDLHELIVSEVKDSLGHEPTKLEMDSLMEYIEASKIRWLVDIELAIMNWKNEKTKKCEWCDKRYLEEELICTDGGLHFCDETCKRDYAEEHGVK